MRRRQRLPPPTLRQPQPCKNRPNRVHHFPHDLAMFTTPSIPSPAPAPCHQQQPHPMPAASLASYQDDWQLRARTGPMMPHHPLTRPQMQDRGAVWLAITSQHPILLVHVCNESASWSTLTPHSKGWLHACPKQLDSQMQHTQCKGTRPECSGPHFETACDME